ncbi:MAG TPA: DUF5752 family protein [Chlamydiales bacterium]|nr:DUF5752 family protein [Chlamydiales bacterium]
MENSNLKPFYLKDCSLAVVATGESAYSLAQFREILTRIALSSIYYHFWGERMRPSFVHLEYHNDFARWVHTALHDNVLSERLGIIDPTEFDDLEEVRKLIIELIDERLNEIEFALWARRELKFHFLRSIIIVFDMKIGLQHPSELKAVLPKLPASSIYLHFIDARGRNVQRIDDFSVWLMEYGNEYADLIKKIEYIDPYFLTLTEIKQKLIEVVNECLP